MKQVQYVFSHKIHEWKHYSSIANEHACEQLCKKDLKCKTWGYVAADTTGFELQSCYTSAKTHIGYIRSAFLGGNCKMGMFLK